MMSPISAIDRADGFAESGGTKEEEETPVDSSSIGRKASAAGPVMVMCSSFERRISVSFETGSANGSMIICGISSPIL